MTFSMPMSVTSTCGTVVHIRPLPSDSTTQTVPVSATAKFAPLTPTFAERNFSRRYRRATLARAGGSSERSFAPSLSLKSSRISARFLWIAGTRMCELVSPASWMMSSARSVSYARMPTPSKYSFNFVSSVAMDLTLTTSRAPWLCAMPATIRLASSASRAQWTWPPARVTDSSSCGRYSSRWRMMRFFRALPASRRASQSGISSTATLRFSRMVRVALPRLFRIWVSASASRADCSKVGVLPSEKASGWDLSVIGSAFLLRAREDLGEVDGPHARASALEAAADVHQARVVAGGTDLGARVQDVAQLVREHRRGGVGVLHGEGAPEAAALPRLSQLHEVYAPDGAQQFEGRVAYLDHAQRVARRVVSNAVRIIGPHVRGFELLHQKFRELEHPGGEHLHVVEELFVVGEIRGHRVELAHHADARARRRDYRLVALEDLDEAPDEGDGFPLIPGVEVHLAAAGLFGGEHDLVAEALEQAHGRPPRLREQRVVKARDEQGHAHSLSSSFDGGRAAMITHDPRRLRERRSGG